MTQFYKANKARIDADLASVRTDIANLLRDQHQNRVESEFAQRCARACPWRFPRQPEPPVQNISADDDPAHGEKSAPVTVVVFTDYQCLVRGGAPRRRRRR